MIDPLVDKNLTIILKVQLLLPHLRLPCWLVAFVAVLCCYSHTREYSGWRLGTIRLIAIVCIELTV